MGGGNTAVDLRHQQVKIVPIANWFSQSSDSRQETAQVDFTSHQCQKEGMKMVGCNSPSMAGPRHES